MKLSRTIAASTVLALGAVAGAVAARQAPAQPREQHKWLQTHVGTWDAALSGVMGESKGTRVVKEGPGGLWTVSEFTGEVGGMPIKGMEFLGYDAAKGEFVSVWIDSMSTKPAIMKGEFDEAAQKLTLEGETIGMDGDNPVKTLNVTHYKSADSMTFELQGPGPDGKPITAMTIEYTRRK
jgi:hypothetical protein